MKKILITILMVLVAFSLVIYNSLYINPHDIKIRTEKLISSKISKDFDGTKIVFFSDLHYGHFTKSKDLDKCVDLINKLTPDIVVFGGDFFDYNSLNDLTEQETQYVLKKMKEINATQGKYAIRGNHDLNSEENTQRVEDLLTKAGFVILVNSNAQIYNGSESYINIVGIDSLLQGGPNTEIGYQNIDSSKYTITFSHCPDIFTYIPYDKTDYVIAGHSHGGQIFLPLINIFYRSTGCTKYFHGKYKENNTILDISNGVGLTKYSIRFLADAEIVVYKLQSK